MSEDENTPATDDALAADASGEREPTAEEATDAAATEAAAGVPVAGEPVAGSVSEAAVAESVEDEDEDEDDGPIEAEDPFSGSEDAKPVDLGDDAEAEAAAALPDMHWYILKVQSNREDSIREGLIRRIKLQGLDHLFGEVIVPKEQVTEFKSGKKRVVSRKLYPGYILVHMVLNDESWYLVRETSGIGDFTGSAGRPSPMLEADVNKLLNKAEEKTDDAPRLKISFRKGDRVKINEGTFENFEGEVEQIDEANGRVTVILSIFGRSTPVDIEYWQIETV
jgi:transcription termination/antitermination protein NusG